MSTEADVVVVAAQVVAWIEKDATLSDLARVASAITRAFVSKGAAREELDAALAAGEVAADVAEEAAIARAARAKG